MKNFRPPQVQTISPTVLNQSSDFKLPANHVQDPLGKRCLSSEQWTDEKHSLYLKSMEASFVNQLYHSKQVLGWRSPKATLSPYTPTQDLGNGYWKRMKNEREKRQIIRRRNEGHGLKAQPWIQQLSQQRNQIPSASPPHHHHVMFFSDIEMMDQNFADDDDEVVECEKKNVKRLKPLMSDTSMHQC